MTTSEFIKDFAKNYGVTIADAEGWIKPVFEHLGVCLLQNNEVRVSQVGTFNHVYCPPRVGRNYSTGERIEIPARMKLEYIPLQRIDKDMKKLPAIDELSRDAIRQKRRRNMPKKTDQSEA